MKDVVRIVVYDQDGMTYEIMEVNWRHIKKGYI